MSEQGHGERIARPRARLEVTAEPHFRGISFVSGAKEVPADAAAENGVSFAPVNAPARSLSGPTGSYIAASPLDGVERVYSWRRLANFPVIAVVGLGKAEALAEANRHASLLLTLGGLSAGLLLTLTIMLSREISRRTRQAVALAERNAELAAARLDIAERKRHAEQIDLLLGEVNHRSKNMHAIVQAIARQTAKTSPDDFVEQFNDRHPHRA